ncbi:MULTISPECIES: serine hydrolase domain-containing protein [unclassified Streptomyces]|uniref:serine hydrolase domain-containing protein n=2 Tax=Streptomyces TaxID=1883 RepID=UPI0011C90892|nr:serine hydrolase [Streptomyces sp. wa22]TXS20153.1 class C beta-lactamase-related serine hydrolase [Streptomyces sp. wa22]WSQ76153.1 serine hydrolase [Streptomyces sp. NBC_01213]
MTEANPLSDLAWTRGYTDPAWIRRFTSAGRELSPTRRVWRGPGGPSDLPARSGPPETSGPGTSELDTMPLALDGNAAITLPDLFAAAQTDAFLVLHRGSVVYERYLHGTEAHTPHFNASAAKSYLGLVAAVLAHQGLLDRDALTRTYVPELAGTAFGEARIQDLLHMGTQVTYGGRPFDKSIEAQRYFAAIAPRMRPLEYHGPTTIREHLLTARATGAPGTGFRYENGNVEALAEVLRRITGLSTSALLGDILWSGIGAEEDAYYVLDGDGVEAASGGFSATARDIARLGEMLRCQGAVGGRQVVPEAVAGTIVGGVPDGYPRRVRLPGAPATVPATLSYHDLWWIPNDTHGSFMASGIHGQRLFVSPGLDLVVVHFGSQVVSPSVPAAPLVQAFLGIGAHLSAAVAA